jgi:hypothetical protein
LENSASNSGTNLSGFSRVTDIPYIRTALNQQVEQVAKISDEMRNYIGPTEADASQLRAALERSFAQSTMSNPPVDRAFFEEQLRRRLEPDSFFALNHKPRYYSSAISLVVLSAALTEALANSFVASGLLISGREKLFPVFDRMDIREKWTLGITLFDPLARIDSGNSIFGRLSALVSMRNSFMHNKTEVSRRDGLAKIKGSKMDLIKSDEKSREEILDFGTLPDELFDFVLDSVSVKSWTFFLSNASFRIDPFGRE